MKIPKAFHPILGVLTGTILFLAGIAVLSAVFVATYKLVLYARPYVVETFSNLVNYLSQWMPL
jgi:hypothetical protein